MLHWWVLIIIAGYNAILFVAALRFVYHYMHVDDFKYSQGILGQVIAVLGIQQVFFLLCLVPTDVYNTKFDGGYNMLYFWQLVYLFVIVYLTVVLPYAVYFYEADSDPRITKTPPWRRALYLTSVTAAVSWGVIGILYAITYKTTVSTTKSVPLKTETDAAGNVTVTEWGDEVVNTPIKVSFLTYLVVLPGFVGWLMFMFQGGIGLASFPISMLRSYKHRPRPISAAQYEKNKRILGERATLLRGFGETLKVKEQHLREKGNGIKGAGARVNFRQKLTKYKQVVTLLEQEHQALETSFKKRGKNPVIAFFILLGGIAASIMTVIWIIQIFLGLLIPQILKREPTARFVDWVLMKIAAAHLLAPELALYSLLLGHLIIAALHGNIRISLRVQSCLPLEPLKKNDTHLNALLFHVALFLLCTCAVVKLGQDSLIKYNVESEAAALFILPNQYMRLFSTFYKRNVFEWMMICITFIAGIWLCIFPEDKPAYNVNDPKTQAKWMKLQKELGIKDPNGEQIETPEEPEEPQGPSVGDKARAKLDRFDQKLENAPREIFRAGAGGMIGS